MLLGAAAAALVLTTTTALAGSGVGGVFNLGQVNTVDAQTSLNGNPGGNPLLKVTSTGTAAAVRGVAVNGIGTNGISTSGVGQQGLSNSGIGTQGTHGNTTGIAPGVQGETNSTDPGGAGVVGKNNGGGPGLKSIVNAGAPPLAVNSGTKVTNLNADKLDDLDSAALQKRVSGTCGAGSAVKSVNENGTVVCEPVAGGGVWSLTGNSGTTPGTNFLGTTDNQALELKVNGQRALRIEPNTGGLGIPASPNLVGGLSANSVDTGRVGSVIAGGGAQVAQGNHVRNDYDFIGAGFSNEVGTPGGGAAAAIVAGTHNAASGDSSFVGAGDSNMASGDRSAVAGGESNIASGSHSAVGGGGFNTASGAFSVIAGGGGSAKPNNVETDYDFIGAGFGNHVGTQGGGGASAIVAGTENVVTGGASFIGAGGLNKVTNAYAFVGAGFANTASGVWSAVSGGQTNTASGDHSAIAGGDMNTASGKYSSVPGGHLNTASGDYSFAAGGGARATQDGSFVWDDSSGFYVDSPAANTFTVQAAGGIWLGANSSPSIGAGRFIDTSTGGYLSTSGNWVSTSDRAKKHDVRPLDKRSVLEKVARMPITSWSYRAEKRSVRHIGPMAQDFYKAFGLGLDNKHIGTIDEGGVALAAIQGLYRENQVLKRKNAALSVRLTRLESAVAALGEEGNRSQAAGKSRVSP